MVKCPIVSPFLEGIVRIFDIEFVKKRLIRAKLIGFKYPAKLNPANLLLSLVIAIIPKLGYGFLIFKKIISEI